MPRSITFGPGFGRWPGLTFRGQPVDGRPAFLPANHGAAHGPDEFVEIENLKRAFLIYLVGITRLDQHIAKQASQSGSPYPSSDRKAVPAPG